MKRKLFLAICIITSLVTLGALAHAIYRYTQIPEETPWYVVMVYWALQVVCLGFATFYNIGFWITWWGMKEDEQLEKELKDMRKEFKSIQ